MPVQFEVLRTSKRAKIWALYMTLSRLGGATEICPDNRGAVHGLKNGQDSCTTANHNDADLWVLIWNKINDVRDTGGVG